ncbi:TM2 domain-containing protein [Flavobacteriaceae bacterium]|jgi:hypothetical protein|nr:TM2 domain-containing protein [Flavobacteriaceae bacterium]MDA7711099.1 TM2 domain-containing protein [Flavobacteriaceae bacterium]MDA8900437.1 TM2 domain-containing protein [Flavobacteriaceae bacterium]
MKQILLYLFLFTFTTNVFASFPVKRNVVKNNSEMSIDATVMNSSASTAVAGDNQIVALVLCFFFGAIGVHRFYLGDIWQGVVQLLTFGGLGFWVLIDFIRIIAGTLGPGW